MRTAYFINQYPKVSHSFIRREILALERLGVQVTRIALRGWDDPVVDVDDKSEQSQTNYVLQEGLTGLLRATMWQLLRTPGRMFKAWVMANRMAKMSDRPLVFHWIYLAEACKVLGLLRAERVDYLHAHFGTNSAEVVMLVRMLGGPAYSFTVHGPEEFDKPLGLHLREKIEHSRFVVAISTFGRSQLFRWVGQEHWHKVKVVHCGLEASFHAQSVVPVPDVPRLVCVGRLCEQKGQLLLLQALRDVLAQGVACQLVLAGDGEMRAEVEQFIRQNGLQQVVRITGWISSAQVRDELLAARAMILPSFAEGLPVVLMEAMALGRPVVTTAIAGIPELVQSGESGWLVPAGDIAALADAMCDVLHTPVDRLTAMGQVGRERALARHDVDTEARKLLALFQEGL